MPARRRRSAATLSTRTAELALATPQVVAHRLLRMAGAGTPPSARDRKEFARMIAEKHSAFGEAWTAMALQPRQAQRAFAAALAVSATPRWPTRSAATVQALGTQLHQAGLAVLGKGLEPVHRRAVANAKRLARTRLR